LKGVLRSRQGKKVRIRVQAVQVLEITQNFTEKNITANNADYGLALAA